MRKEHEKAFCRRSFLQFKAFQGVSLIATVFSSMFVPLIGLSSTAVEASTNITGFIAFHLPQNSQKD